MDASQIAVARNSLVPYLDLFDRLEDAELRKLSGAPPEIIADMRRRVRTVQDAFSHRRALLVELDDAELIKITGADERTIRFWRMTEQSPKSRAEGSRRAEQAHASDSQSRPIPAASQSQTAMRASQSHTSMAAPQVGPAMVQRDDSVEIQIDPEDAAAAARDEEVSSDPGLGDALRGLMQQQQQQDQQQRRQQQEARPQPQPIEYAHEPAAPTLRDPEPPQAIEAGLSGIFGSGDF
jgi:hypothetical protein